MTRRGETTAREPDEEARIQESGVEQRVDDLEYGTALWLRWAGPDVGLVVLPDCPVAGQGPDGEGCCLFADHAAQHTWEEAHPMEDPCTS
jgi:hypothetical protein